MLFSKKSNFIIFLSLLLFNLSISVSAQTNTITGKVTDADAKPLANVSVVIKGTTNGTTTDANGAYQLKTIKAAGNTLVFSFVGFTDKEITQKGNSINVQMETTNQSLDAVVVVGYGTQKRKDVTGSIVTLDPKRLENLPNTNLLQAMEGSIPGLSLNTNGGGAEGNNVSIVIRGQKSISGNTNPLIILDGIPYNGSISDINPSDVASVDILKDASAAGIYGAKSANGVILVTTKKGSGKTVISYDGYYGTARYANLPPILTGADFYNFKITREPNSVTNSEKALYNSGNFTNWLDLTTRTGTKVQHTFSARGGSSTFKYFASLALLDVKGIAVNDDYKRLSSRVNLEANLTKWLLMAPIQHCLMITGAVCPQPSVEIMALTYLIRLHLLTIL